MVGGGATSTGGTGGGSDGGAPSASRAGWSPQALGPAAAHGQAQVGPAPQDDHGVAGSDRGVPRRADHPARLPGGSRSSGTRPTSSAYRSSSVTETAPAGRRRRSTSSRTGPRRRSSHAQDEAEGRSAEPEQRRDHGRRRRQDAVPPAPRIAGFRREDQLVQDAVQGHRRQAPHVGVTRHVLPQRHHPSSSIVLRPDSRPLERRSPAAGARHPRGVKVGSEGAAGPRRAAGGLAPPTAGWNAGWGTGDGRVAG